MMVDTSLFIVTGVSGAGKTNVAQKLCMIIDSDFDVYDMDLILEDYGQFIEVGKVWLKIAYWNSEKGRHTILCGSMPDYHLTEQDLFSEFKHIYYCYLTCSDEVRAKRLAARAGAWTMENIQFANDWDHALKEQAMNSIPPISVIDTTLTTAEQTAETIWKWVKKTMES